MSSAFTIGRLAIAAGVHVETVRYYQRRGLLPEPSRPPGGIRRYGNADLARLRFVRHAQAMGFSLDEVAGLLQVTGAGACAHTRQLAEHKLAEVRRKLDELRHLESDLMQLVAECARTRQDECCPTLDRLEHAGESDTLALPRAAGHARSCS